MGGKRPDQGFQAEPSVTDKKSLTDDRHIHEEDKQHLHSERGKLAKKEEEVDDMSADSFPASDPPSTTPTSIGGHKADGK
jgi:hypothetical protein